MADQQNPYSIAPSDNFAEYLQFAKPQNSSDQTQPSGFMHNTGKVAMFLDKFIEGAQQGSYKKQQLQLAKERQSDQAVNQYLQILDTKDPVSAQKLRNEIITERGKQALSFLNDQGTTTRTGKRKKGGDQQDGDQQGGDQNHGRHVLAALKNIGEGMLGGPVKKWEGYGDKMGNWAQQIMSMPSKEQGYQTSQGALDQRVQQLMAQKKKAGNNDPLTYTEIQNDPTAKALTTRLKTYYKDQAGDVDRNLAQIYPDPNAGLTADQAAANKAGAEAAKAKAQFEAGVYKNVDVGGTGLPSGVSADDVKAGMFRNLFGVVPPTSKVVQLYNPETHGHQAGIAYTDPNTGTETIKDQSGRSLTGWVVDTTRASGAKIERTPTTINGQRVWAFTDFTDPDKPTVSIPKDANGKPLPYAAGTAGSNEAQKAVATSIAASQKLITDHTNILARRETAQNQVRNSPDYILADDAKKKQMLKEASAPFDKQMSGLKTQFKAQLSLVKALGGLTGKAVQDAEDNGLLGADDADDLSDVETTTPPRGGAVPPAVSDQDFNSLLNH